MAMVHDNHTWLGPIIVREEHSNRGIGAAITMHFIQYSLSRRVEFIILAASEMGLPIILRLDSNMI
jgi:predicted N-acetyltransferase YhbS